MRERKLDKSVVDAAYQLLTESGSTQDELDSMDDDELEIDYNHTLYCQGKKTLPVSPVLINEKGEKYLGDEIEMYINESYEEAVARIAREGTNDILNERIDPKNP